jgi:hypothetical protein
MLQLIPLPSEQDLLQSCEVRSSAAVSYMHPFFCLHDWLPHQVHACTECLLLLLLLLYAGAGALSIVEVPVGKVKFAAGAYMGDPQFNPEQMAVFLFYMDVSPQLTDR